MNNHLPRRYPSLFVLIVGVVALLPAGPAHSLSPEDAYELRHALQAFDHEPDVYQVQQAALQHRGLASDKPDRWTRRARLSTLLPQVQGQASWLDQRDQRNRFRENISADDDGIYERNHAQHYLYDDLRLRGLYSLRLTFNLSELIYHRQELNIQREVRAQWSARDDRIQQITELYFARRRYQLYQRLLPTDDMQENLDRHLAIEALTARIDAATGGWFRQQLEEAH